MADHVVGDAADGERLKKIVKLDKEMKSKKNNHKKNIIVINFGERYSYTKVKPSTELNIILSVVVLIIIGSKFEIYANKRNNIFWHFVYVFHVNNI
jgi:hypothetical protein